MISRTVIAFAAALLSGSAYGASREENLAAPIVGVEDAVLTDAPNVPPPMLGSTMASTASQGSARASRVRSALEIRVGNARLSGRSMARQGHSAASRGRNEASKASSSWKSGVMSARTPSRVSSALRKARR